jgi:hypothetical protein
VGDVGFWQGAFRDAAAAGYEQARAAIEARREQALEPRSPGRTIGVAGAGL